MRMAQNIVEEIFKQSAAREFNVPEDQLSVSAIKSNPKGVGYLGQIFFATVTLDLKRKLHLVVKKAFTDSKIRQCAPIDLCFQNEIDFYTEIWPQFIQTISNQYEIVPRHFLSSKTMISNDETASVCGEFIVLEDLKKQYGFEMIPKTALFSPKQFELVMQTYGILHGLSFVYRFKYPAIFEQFFKCHSKAHDKFVSGTNYSITGATILQWIANEYFYDSKLIFDKLQKYTDAKYFQQIVTDLLYNINTNYVALLHVDCWTNNMLFRYSNDQLKEMRLIDWQFARFGHPALDLAMVMYCGGDQELFHDFDHYLDIYYDQLSTVIRGNCNGDPTVLFPIQVLKADWRRFSLFGLLVGCMMIKVKLTKSDDCPDLTDGIMEHDNTQFIDAPMDKVEYQKRITQVIHHLNDLDAL